MPPEVPLILIQLYPTTQGVFNLSPPICYLDKDKPSNGDDYGHISTGILPKGFYSINGMFLLHPHCILAACGFYPEAHVAILIGKSA